MQANLSVDLYKHHLGAPMTSFSPRNVQHERTQYRTASVPRQSPLKCGRSFAGSLSTKEGKIVDENGSEVILKGFALSGFESSFTMTGDVSRGSDSVAHDWRTNMYRWVPLLALSYMLAMLGVRLEARKTVVGHAPLNVLQPECIHTLAVPSYHD